jgi:hypothetical protein
MKSEVGEKERRTRNPTARDRQPVMPFQGNKGVSTKTKKKGETGYSEIKNWLRQEKRK